MLTNPPSDEPPIPFIEPNALLFAPSPKYISEFRITMKMPVEIRYISINECLIKVGFLYFIAYLKFNIKGIILQHIAFVNTIIIEIKAL